MITDMTLFEDYQIRRVYEESETLLRLVQSVPSPKAEPIKKVKNKNP